MIVRAQIEVDIRRQFRFWIAIVLAGLLKVVPWPMPFLRDAAAFLSASSFWIGIPLLAAMPFAWEFQYGTIASLMSQPVERKAVWTGKMLVAVVSVISIALLYSLLWNRTLSLTFITGAWAALALGGAAFLVLQTRSSSGGQVTNILHGLIALMAWAAPWMWLSGYERNPTAEPLRILLTGWAASVGIHSLAMLWLGRRKWLRFQATGGAAGTTASSANPPELLRPILSGLLGSRPASPWLNLLRKEVVLLWPVWVLALGILVLQLLLAVAASLAAGLLSELVGPWQDLSALLVAIGVGFLAVLSGTLSVADERLSGTQSWHMTLPISARRQWAIKLAAAIIPVPLCAAVLAATFVILFGIPGGLLELFDTEVSVSIFSVLFLVPLMAFWCGTAAREALQTLGWLIALCIALMSAAAVGFWLGENPVWFSSFMTLPVSSVLALPVNYLVAARVHGDLREPFTHLLLVVPVGAALFQSYFLYRTQPFGRTGPAVRRLLVLAILVGAACCTSAVSSGVVDNRVDALRKDALLEIVRAFDASKSNLSVLRAGRTVTIPLEELSRSQPLSSSTTTFVGSNALSVFGTWDVVDGRFTTERRNYTLSLRFSDRTWCHVNLRVAERFARFYCYGTYSGRPRHSGDFHL